MSSHRSAIPLRLHDRSAKTRRETAVTPLDKSLRVTVAMPDETPFNDIATMVAQTLTEEGVDAQVVRDGDEIAFERQVLLLVGSGRWFPKFEDMCRRFRHRRPQVILWHLQPLPPPVFTRRASELGQRLLNAQWDDLLGPWLKPLNHLIPIRGGGRHLFQRILGLGVLGEFKRIGGPDYANVSNGDLRLIFEEAAWLEQAWSQTPCWIDTVATDTPARYAFLRQMDIPASLVPLGYHPLWGEARSKTRDIDVLFFGNVRYPTRISLVPAVLQQLRDWGYNTLEEKTFPSGPERVQLLSRARVVLNVLRLPWEFPGLRILPSVACGALLVSNEAVQNEPYQAGVHFVPAPRARMAESIAHLLDHEEERSRKADLALDHLARELSLKQMLPRLLSPRPTTLATNVNAAA